MSEQKAVYYGQVELIPGIISDGYVLDNGIAVMSERGTADLLGMAHPTLRSMVGNWPPKYLKPFINIELSMVGNSVEVFANNSPYKNRNIIVYSASSIENLTCGYALAFGNGHLRKHQKHIGKRAITLMRGLVVTVLEISIKETCGFQPEIQKTAQKNYMDMVKFIRKFGFTCSLNNNIAIKKDIIQFLKVPEPTLNSFLRRHSNEIKPIRLDFSTIQSLGSKARRLNGYQEDDVAKIAFGMETEISIKLKKMMFGQAGSFVKPQVKTEIQWRKVLAKVFKGFNLKYNYLVGKYRVDFFVPIMGLCLECNGYDCHNDYDKKEEKKREQNILNEYSLIRFHHQVSLETLFNGILQVKKGKVIKLYNVEDICNRLQLNLS